jgi:NAD(P)-dependent dehydrogenase (short-subunit alcohol dehydrogenase family)
MKTIVVLGGSSSVGRAICDKFNTSDNKLIATYYSNNNFIDIGSDNIERVYLDLASDKSIINFSEKLISDKICIDVLISLIGNLPGKNLLEYNFDEIDNVMSVNFSGQAKLFKCIFPLLGIKSRSLLLSSISAQKGSYDPIYAASKGAILSFIKSLLPSLPVGSTINAIAPGLIQDSSMFNEMDLSRQEIHLSQIHSGKFLGKDDLSKIIFDLCQDHWSHLNGACIDLNGGQYVR